jgi:SAM-dependent methyltransferase
MLALEADPTAVLKDDQTVQYFDNYVPDYCEERALYIEDVVNRLGTPESSLVDIGCGTGSLLKELKNHTPIADFCGIDVSRKSLDKCRERLECETHAGSICDAEFMGGVGRQFDFAVVMAVLHHLIAPTRRESKAFARQAVLNSLKLVKDGGHLIVMEPVFSPAWLATAIFHVKRFVTRFTSKRVGLLGYWNNIGEPVVSYFTQAQLVEMLSSIEGCEVREVHAEPHRVKWMMRLAGFRERADAYVVVRKLGSAARG